MDPGIQWLLQSRDPSVRYFALTDLLGRTARARDVQAARAAIPRGPRVRALLAGQQRDGSFGNHPYSKWLGAHWRLVSLVELGIAPKHPCALKAADDVLRWLARGEHARIYRVAGKPRRHASCEGNALAACVRIGLAKDVRVRRLVDILLETQWEDGGWNCDTSPDARVSSFYGSITPMWGLGEYARATGDGDARAAAERAAELFLDRRLFRARRSGTVINKEWVRLHYPLYWHYDVLHGALMLTRMGKAHDPRMSEALDVIESKRRKDGTWQPGNYYWKPSGRVNADPVDWGRSGPNEMITLNALRVLKASGRLSV